MFAPPHLQERERSDAPAPRQLRRGRRERSEVSPASGNDGGEHSAMREQLQKKLSRLVRG